MAIAPVLPYRKLTPAQDRAGAARAMETASNTQTVSAGMFPGIGRIAGHSFLPAVLSADSVVVDLGVNQAEFSTKLHALTGCRVIGVEAAPELAARAPDHDWLTVRNTAITGTDGPVRLHLNASGDASLLSEISEAGADTVEVPGATLASFLAAHDLGDVDLLKIDIEGAEMDMFDTTPDAVLERVAQITIEFHDFMDPALGPGVERIKNRMRALGFHCLTFSRNNTDVLFVNRRRIALGPLARAYALALFKYARGVGRRIAVLGR